MLNPQPTSTTEAKELRAHEAHDEEQLAAVLHMRYADDDIYTAVGGVLLAVNPYQQVRACHPDEIRALARANAASADLTPPPHIFHVAARAYAALLDEGPQSILVSGESGAGKTETTKLALRCLAELSASSASLADAMLEVSLLLESFGNAQTLLNKNSSRFGKWQELHFSSSGRICGCTVRHYLLELARVSKPSEGERNFHVFHQLLAGASADEKAALRLGLATAADFRYTAGGARLAADEDDARQWHSLQAALESVGVDVPRRDALNRLLGGILHLGNVDFAERSSPGPLLLRDASAASLAADLLGFDLDKLTEALTTRTVFAGGEPVLLHHSIEQAIDARDALSRAVYSTVFEGLVDHLNEHLHPDRPALLQLQSPTTRRAKLPAAGMRHQQTAMPNKDENMRIGLLDIFGFENFKRNGFEQLCINFANEYLQNFFMDALIQREQAIYDREGITCEHIKYPSNVPQLDLLSGRGGVLALLDEEGRVPGGSEEKYVYKMHSKFEASTIYSRPTFGSAAIGQDLGAEFDKTCFVIRHFVEPVLYSAHDWLEKNRGRMQSNLIRLLRTSESPALRIAYPQADADVKLKTVTGTFLASLRSLGADLLMTNQHFIRCIKPNQRAVPKDLDVEYVRRQLRYLGMQSVIDIEDAGYSVKLKMRDFIRRYRCIAFDRCDILNETGGGVRQVCLRLLLLAAEIGGATAAPSADGNPLDAKLVQLGKTMVFMRPEAREWLERPRREARLRAVIFLQAGARLMLSIRIRFLLSRHAPAARLVAAALMAPEARQSAGAVRMRIGEIVRALDALMGLWESSGLSPSLAPAVDVAWRSIEAYEAELELLEGSLRAEIKATAELNHELSREWGPVSSDGRADELGAFGRLKRTVSTGLVVDCGLTCELDVALSAASRLIDERFNGMLDAWEAQMAKEAAERETKRRLQCKVEEERLEALAAQGLIDVWEVRVRAGARHSVSKARGVSAVTNQRGIAFDDDNVVIKLLRSTIESLGPMERQLKLGDIVLAVDGEPLEGRRASHAMDQAKSHSGVTLTVTRLGDDIGGPDSLPRGDHDGWLGLTPTKINAGRLLPMADERRVWGMIRDGSLSLFTEERHSRPADELTRFSLQSRRPTLSDPERVSLLGAVLRVAERAPPSGGKRYGDGAQRIVLRADDDDEDGSSSRFKPRSNALVRDLIDRDLFPFRITWPGQVGRTEYLCAASTDEERNAWIAALQQTIDHVTASEPTRGKLAMRRSGLLRRRWKSLWFELVPTIHDTHRAAVLRWYDPEHAASPRRIRASIDVDQGSLLVPSAPAGGKRLAFSVSQPATGKGASANAVYLAAPSGADRDRWVAAFARALSRKPESVAGRPRIAPSKAEAELTKKTLQQLQLLLAYLGGATAAARHCRDKQTLAQLIIRERARAALQRGQTGTAASEETAKIERYRTRLRARSDEELRVLAAYLDLECAEAEDKETVIARIIGQKFVGARKQSAGGAESDSCAAPSA